MSRIDTTGFKFRGTALLTKFGICTGCFALGTEPNGITMRNKNLRASIAGYTTGRLLFNNKVKVGKIQNCIPIKAYHRLGLCGNNF